MATATAPTNDLFEFVATYAQDPMGFVYAAYPWGEPGVLEHEDGPDEIQRGFLQDLGRLVRERNFNGRDPVMPILMAENSGHGTGKSAMGAWIANWIMSTRPMSRGTVTAGTAMQLKTKTWAAIQKWTKLSITADWFNVRSKTIEAKLDPENWNVAAFTCRPENAQSFAGQHARESTSWYLFDEASEVPDTIWETAQGGLTDGEPMWFAWGQPVRNSGMFHKVCFGREGVDMDWDIRSVDSRQSRFTNKQLIQKWIDKYGIDSDFCRVRILGLPPSSDELQYIDLARIQAARRRQVQTWDEEPLIAGMDVSGGGNAWTVIRFRRGRDARSVPAPIRISGERSRDRDVLVGIASEVMRDRSQYGRVAAMFIDSAFGAPLYERLRLLGYDNVHEVTFGGASPDPHCLNWRAFMWMKLKDWLQTGAIQDDEDLAEQLSGPGYHINRSSKLVIESKEDMRDRGIESPDDADALALTFAQSVAPVVTRREAPEESSGWGREGWMR